MEIVFDQDELNFKDSRYSDKIIPVPIEKLQDRALLAYEYLNFTAILVSIKIDSFPGITIG